MQPEYYRMYLTKFLFIFFFINNIQGDFKEIMKVENHLDLGYNLRVNSHINLHIRHKSLK